MDFKSKHIAIPSYFYPSTFLFSSAYWSSVLSTASQVGIVIINPNSGPGNMLDINYLNQTKVAQKLGINVLGYVHTQYGKRDIKVVKEEIDKFYTLYGVDGIFFDESSSNVIDIEYYQNLHSYVKRKIGKNIIILNPGVPVPEIYAYVCDIIVTFENDGNKYNLMKPLGWEKEYPASKFWHILYNISPTQLPTILDDFNRNHASWLFVTSTTLENNPYGSLPIGDYWNTVIKNFEV